MSLLSNRKSLFIAMITASAVFVMFGYMTLKPAEQVKTTEYNFVVAKNNIKKGAVIQDEDIAIKNFPINIQGTYKATGEIVGRKAAVDILPGKPVLNDFIEKPKVQGAVNYTPNPGFRTVPVMITTDVVPKDITQDLKFDFITSDDSIRIENLRILDVVNAQSNRGSKIVLLEIRDCDIQPFLKAFAKVKGVNILRKNPDDYGEYIFKTKNEEEKPKPADNAYIGSSKLPPIDKFQHDPFGDFRGYSDTNKVELIVGSSKKTMEFNE